MIEIDEIRLQQIRYGGTGDDFMCVITLQEMPDTFWGYYEDMVGGDIEYSRAEDFLRSEENQISEGFYFCYGRAATGTLEKAERGIRNILTTILKDAGINQEREL